MSTLLYSSNIEESDSPNYSYDDWIQNRHIVGNSESYYQLKHTGSVSKKTCIFCGHPIRFKGIHEGYAHSYRCNNPICILKDLFDNSDRLEIKPSLVFNDDKSKVLIDDKFIPILELDSYLHRTRRLTVKDYYNLMTYGRISVTKYCRYCQSKIEFVNIIKGYRSKIKCNNPLCNHKHKVEGLLNELGINSTLDGYHTRDLIKLESEIKEIKLRLLKSSDKDGVHILKGLNERLSNK